MTDKEKIKKTKKLLKDLKNQRKKLTEQIKDMLENMDEVEELTPKQQEVYKEFIGARPLFDEDDWLEDIKIEKKQVLRSLRANRDLLSDLIDNLEKKLEKLKKKS